MLLLFCLNILFNNEISLVDKWVNEQATTLKESESKFDNPAEQSKALFSLVFITHHVTADETTLPGEWGQVTSDGTASFPVHIDSYDLAERMRKVCAQLKWPVQMDETDDGPIMIFGKGEEKQVMIVAQGQYGLWQRLKKNQAFPRGVSQDKWQKILKARKAELLFRVGQNKALKALKIDNCFAPILARCRILRGETLSADDLHGWMKKWPADGLILERCLRQARSENREDIVGETIELGKKNPTVGFFIEAAFWYRNQKKQAISVQMLENALKIDPHHGKANQLLKAWKEN